MGVYRQNIYRNALIAGGLGFITFGWDAGVLGGILLTPEFQEAMDHPDTNTTSMIASIFLLASWLGCIIVSVFGMVMGRRMWIIVGNIIQILGSVVSASSFSSGQLIAGRLLVGVGNGFLTSMIPVYVAEMAVAVEKRGQGVNAMIAAATVGTALAYWVDFGMVFAHNTQAVWRFPVAFQILWSLLTIAWIYPNPDTPRYHYAKNQPVLGDKVLSGLYSQPPTAAPVLRTKELILASLTLERSATASLRPLDFLWDTSSLQAARRIRTGVILVGVAYLMGTDMIFYYTTTIFQVYIGLAPLTSSGLSGVACTVLAVSNCVGVLCMEKFGRRTWLMAGAIGQSVFMAAFTGLLAVPGKQTGAAAAAMLFGWIAVFGPTWGPVTYVYSSEIMPLRYRHIGFALSISSQWIMAFLTVYAGPIAIADPNVGWKTWIWFLVFNVLAVPFVYYCCPETRRRSLEDIDLLFMNSSLRDTEAAKTLEHEAPSGSRVSDEASVQEEAIAVKRG